MKKVSVSPFRFLNGIAYNIETNGNFEGATIAIAVIKMYPLKHYGREWVGGTHF